MCVRDGDRDGDRERRELLLPPAVELSPGVCCFFSVEFDL